MGGTSRVGICGGVVLLVSLAVAPAASAHHSFAMFDLASRVTIEGVVTAFQWTNPHVYIEVDVADASGTKHWTIELGSPSILQRGGWKFSDVKKGDKVTAVLNPLKNGDPAGLLSRITLADGRVLGNGGPPPPAPAASSSPGGR